MVSVFTCSRGSSVPVLRTASRSGSTSRCFSRVRTDSARARLSESLASGIGVSALERSSGRHLMPRRNLDVTAQSCRCR
jgi:hypothetical protein